MLSTSPPSASQERVVAVDVLRGIVMLLLVPDLTGGFSLHRMDELHPGHWAWAPLAAQFTHVPWRGAAIWDLVMPVFVFVVGIAMSLSWHKRRAQGAKPRDMFTQALMRSVTLVVLGLLLLFKARTPLQELLPFIVLASGLPLESLWTRLTGQRSPATRRFFALLLPASLLALATACMLLRLEQLDYRSAVGQILVLLGLAYLPAFALQVLDLRAQAWAGAAIVGAYGLAFALYPLLAPMAGASGDGLPAAWSHGSNLGAGIDRRIFGALSAAEPYADNPHGYALVQFVPLIAVILWGAMAGRWIVQGLSSERLALRLTVAGVAGAVAGGLLDVAGVPLIKSLWTPSWTLFSTGVAALLLGLLVAVLRHPPRERWFMPLIVLGANPVLLYVVAYRERWRVLALWERLLGERLLASDWRPLLESCLVLLTLWLFAFALHRARMHVRV